MISAPLAEHDEIAAILCNQYAIVSNRIGENRLICEAGAEFANIDYTLNVVAGFLQCSEQGVRATVLIEQQAHDANTVRYVDALRKSPQ